MPYRILILVMFFCAACKPAARLDTLKPEPVVLYKLEDRAHTDAAAGAQLVTPTQTGMLIPLATNTPQTTATLSLPLTNTPQPVTPTSPALTIFATPTSAPLREEHFVLGRPISRSGVDWIDRTYAYGDTQFSSLEVHRGVEFRNPRGTPVLAAAHGTVIFAGTDNLEAGFPGPYPDYYGNVVIIWHEVTSPEGQALFTVYGHLDRIEVALNQQVEAGAQLGTVGATGIAFGAHLHFEVRVGSPMDFNTTRNPEMWIIPYFEHGVIAGRITQPDGSLAQGVAVTITRVDGAQASPIYAFTYWDNSVNSDPAWGENFTVGDLPQGQYEVLVSERTGVVRFRETFVVEGSRITWVEIALDRPMPNAIGELEDDEA